MTCISNTTTKTMNNSLTEIGEQLLNAESILIFPHVNLDGDAIGSAIALCKALRDLDKQVHVLIAEQVPEAFQFLDGGYCTTDKNLIENPDVGICVDCGERSRFYPVQDCFSQAKVKICVDHHATSKPFADFNYIDEHAAANAENIYKLLKAMNVTIDQEIGEAIFTGIMTDTGRFQYSNTSKESHLIAAELYNANIDVNKIAVAVYQSVSLEKMRLTNLILDRMEVFAGGRAAITYVTGQMISESGAEPSETEGITEELRNIKGVEVAAFIKEQSKEKVKVSFRSKGVFNVMELAQMYGGGGHKKAAGCTLLLDIASAKEQLIKEISNNLEI